MGSLCGGQGYRFDDSQSKRIGLHNVNILWRHLYLRYFLGGIITMTIIITVHHHRLSPRRLENPGGRPIDPNHQEANQNQGLGGEIKAFKV